MSHLSNRGNILNRPKEVRRLDHHASRIARNSRIQRSHIHAPIRPIPNFSRRNLLVLRIRRNHLAILRMHRPRNHRAIAPRHPHRHHDRLGRSS